MCTIHNLITERVRIVQTKIYCDINLTRKFGKVHKNLLPSCKLRYCFRKSNKHPHLSVEIAPDSCKVYCTMGLFDSPQIGASERPIIDCTTALTSQHCVFTQSISFIFLSCKTKAVEIKIVLTAQSIGTNFHVDFTLEYFRWYKESGLNESGWQFDASVFLTNLDTAASTKLCWVFVLINLSSKWMDFPHSKSWKMSRFFNVTDNEHATVNSKFTLLKIESEFRIVMKERWCHSLKFKFRIPLHCKLYTALSRILTQLRVNAFNWTYAGTFF